MFVYLSAGVLLFNQHTKISCGLSHGTPNSVLVNLEDLNLSKYYLEIILKINDDYFHKQH
jgi:hypothetical protein